MIREAAISDRRRHKARDAENLELVAAREESFSETVFRHAREDVLKEIDTAVNGLSDTAKELWSWFVCRANQHTRDKKGYMRVAWAIDAVLKRRTRLSEEKGLDLNETTVREAWKEIYVTMEPIGPQIEGMLW